MSNLTTNDTQLFVGIDVGSTTTKIVAINPESMKFYYLIINATTQPRPRVYRMPWHFLRINFQMPVSVWP